MEKDNDSKEESSDYSCSPVTKNELLTAAKYRAIKFAILFVLAISISLFLFICSKSLSRLLRVPHWKTKNERKFYLSLPPFPILENLFFPDFVFCISFSTFFPLTSLIILFIIFLPLVVLFICWSKNLSFIEYHKIIVFVQYCIFIFVINHQ